jgi:uncharacterized protein (TIGR02145 family)
MKNIYIIILLLALNGCKKSDDGTVEVVPLAPTELKGTIVSKDQVDLSWKDNSTNETGYKIERKTDSGNFTEIGSTATDVTTFSDKTVSLNTNYTYRVYSFNKVGKSIQYSNEVSIKTINVPTLTTTAITDISVNSAKSGGSISSDGSSSISAKGVVWGTAINPTIALSTKTSDGTGTGAFSSSITGLAANTKYYVRAYATNTAGTSYGDELSFTTKAPFTFNTVVGANGKIWMDRNLGATRVATSSTDAESYGDLYQWGRGADGHQIRTSATTSTLSSTDVPGNAQFILATTAPYDWRSGQNANLWQGLNGTNNPCPSGYRLPTEAEWDAERLSWSSNNNSAGAFASPLKLPMAGGRKASDGSLYNVGSSGNYWRSTVSTTSSFTLIFGSSYAGINATNRASGLSVRCIKDY